MYDFRLSLGKNMCSCLSVVAIAVLFIGIAIAEDNGMCMCDPNCEGVVKTSANNLTILASECGSGLVLPRLDCPCCHVCAKRLGEDCDTSNRPCNSDDNLICGDDGKCREAGCQHEGQILAVGNTTYDPECKTKCVCKSNGEVQCTPLNCGNGLYRIGFYSKDSACHEKPIDKCCARVICSESNNDPEEENEKEEERIEEANSGKNIEKPKKYEAQKSEVKTETASSESTSQASVSSTEIINEVQPLLKEDGKSFSLSIADDEDDEENQNSIFDVLPSPSRPPTTTTTTTTFAPVPEMMMTSTSTVAPAQDQVTNDSIIVPFMSTNDSTLLNSTITFGCMENGTKYVVGEEYFIGCEKKCVCHNNGSIICSDRCSIPYFSRGTFSKDPLCLEKPLDTDECCVQVACAHGGGLEARIDKNPCEEEKCGPHAECHHEVSPSALQDTHKETLCVCQEGYMGNPYDLLVGCKSATTQPPLVNGSMIKNCTLRNVTILAGDEYFDGCHHRCTCNQQAEIVCRPRCPSKPSESEIEPGCTLKPDERDSCCQIVVCEGRSENGTSIRPTAGDREPFRPDVPFDGCKYNNKTYQLNESFYDGCEQQCVCEGYGDVICQPRCPPTNSPPTIKNCETLPDPEDSCCMVTLCDDQPEIHVLDDVMKNNITDAMEVNHVNISEDIKPVNIMDEEKEAPAVMNTTILSSGEHNMTHVIDSMLSSEEAVTKKPLEKPKVGRMDDELQQDPYLTYDDDHSRNVQIERIEPMGESTVYIHAKVSETSKLQKFTVDTVSLTLSTDLSEWQDVKLRKDQVVIENNNEIIIRALGLDPGKKYYFKVRVGKMESALASVTIPSKMPEVNSEEISTSDETYETYHNEDDDQESGNDSGGNKSNEQPDIEVPDAPMKDNSCQYKGRSLKIGEELNDNCREFCVCNSNGVRCTPINCPDASGLELLNPHCLQWGSDRNFVPTPEKCCSEFICINNGTCEVEGKLFDNFEEIPRELMGDYCDQQCFCHHGNVTCKSLCEHLPDRPPVNLPCPPQLAVKTHPPGDDCCLQWTCTHFQPPPGLLGNHIPLPPGYGSHGLPHPSGIHPAITASADKLTNLTAIAVNDSTIRFGFMVPRVLVGLNGLVEVLYTTDPGSNDWERTIFSEPHDDLIKTSYLEFDLPHLEPDTDYSLKVNLIMRDVHNSPTSEVVHVRTTPIVTTSTFPPQIPIDAELVAIDTRPNSTLIQWRKFTESELQFLDGVQLKYRDASGKIYTTTPLIHRSVSSYLLEKLSPNTNYEVDILLLPFNGQKTELISQKPIHVQTTTEEDPYKFDIHLRDSKVTESSVELVWSGIPYPVDKFVNIFQVIYQSDHEKDQSSTFKLAKRDTPMKVVIKSLKPGISYRIWMEAYLTNGKKKRSNVLSVMTKPGVFVNGKTEQGKLESQPSAQAVEGESYYGALVAVAIIAALAIAAILALLVIILRKQTQAKAPITPRKSEAAYDNPTYKNCDNEVNNGSTKTTTEP